MLYVLSVVNMLNMHKHWNTSSGPTSSQWKQRKHTEQNEETKKNQKKNQIQCMMHSQNRHSRSLTFDLFTFSNSPRPPLADLYTTCIYKQHKGLTAVCERRLPVCQTDRFYRYYYCYDYSAFQAWVSPDDLTVDCRFFHPNKTSIMEETPQYSSFFFW